MLDRDSISPSGELPSDDDRSVTDSLHGSSFTRRDIDSFVASHTDIPTVVVGRSPEHRVDSTHEFIIFIFVIVSIRDLRERHLTLASESAPRLESTGRSSDLTQWIDEISSTDKRDKAREEGEKKYDFFHKK